MLSRVSGCSPGDNHNVRGTGQQAWVGVATSGQKTSSHQGTWRSMHIAMALNASITCGSACSTHMRGAYARTHVRQSSQYHSTAYGHSLSSAQAAGINPVDLRAMARKERDNRSASRRDSYAKASHGLRSPQVRESEQPHDSARAHELRLSGHLRGEVDSVSNAHR